MMRYGATDPKAIKLSVEEPFQKDFALHVAQGYEVEALQIFTPEVLQFLKEKSAHFSIEFAEDRMYIYDDLFISDRAKLQELLDVARQIFDSLGPLLNRLHDDFAALHPYYKK